MATYKLNRVENNVGKQENAQVLSNVYFVVCKCFQFQLVYNFAVWYRINRILVQVGNKWLQLAVIVSAVVWLPIILYHSL